jgi:aminomuconate-semialdehyde/2-hydroxymuconate-6-semialdehyde dehydrogenase
MGAEPLVYNKQIYCIVMNILNYINGEFKEPEEGDWLENFNPATGHKYGQIPDSSSGDVEAAYQAAKAAFPAWSGLTQQERSNYLLKIADLIEVHQEKLAMAESTDNGKPLSLARRMDIPRASDNFRFYATAALHTHSETYDMGKQGFNYVLNRPVGVAGLISPWNLPLYLFTWKVAPALAVGNTVVAKPSEVTPATAFLLSEICAEAGLPAGVFNIIHGTGPRVGHAIVAHPHIPIISFTGGTSTGAAIAKTAAPMFKKLSLELGGKNPNIIFADCDYEQMLKTTLASSFTNQGQICLCGSRILVEKSLYPKFLADFVAGTQAMKVGDPLESDTRIGAIVSRAQYEKVLHYIMLAKVEGGKIESGGKPVYEVNERCKDGWFLEPTIITGLDENCRVNQEEIFGPVVSIIPFETEEEALRIANSTRYGLSATLWTNNLKRAHRMGAQLESGIIWVNCWLVRDLRTPFGGMKDSGVGREGGFEALKFFTETRNICIQL